MPPPSPIILTSSPAPSSPPLSPSRETSSRPQDTNYSCLPCLLLFNNLSHAQRHYQTEHPLNHDDQVAVTAQITVHQRLDHDASEYIKQIDHAAQLVNQVRASRLALQASGAHRVLRDMLHTPGQKRSAPAMLDGPARKVSRSLPVRDPSSPMPVSNCSPLTVHLDLRPGGDPGDPGDPGSRHCHCLHRYYRGQTPRADLPSHRHAVVSRHLRRNAQHDLESV